MELAGVIVFDVISLIFVAYNLWPVSERREERAVRKFERREMFGGW